MAGNATYTQKDRFGFVTNFLGDNAPTSTFSRKVFGSPYAYNPMIDTLGNVYNKTIGSNFSMLHIIPGEMTTSGITSQVFKTVANWIPGVVMDGRNVAFKEQMYAYFKYVKAMHYFTYSAMMSYDRAGGVPAGSFSSDWILDQTFDKKIIEAAQANAKTLASFELESSKKVDPNNLYNGSIPKNMTAKLQLMKEIDVEIKAYLDNFSPDDRITALSTLMNDSDVTCTTDEDGNKTCTSAAMSKSDKVFIKKKEAAITKIRELQARASLIEAEYKKDVLAKIQDKAKTLTPANIVSEYKSARERRTNANTQSYGLLFYADAAVSARDNISTSYIENANLGMQNSTAAANRQSDANTIANVGIFAASVSNVKMAVSNLFDRAKRIGSVGAASATNGEQVGMALIWSNTNHSKTYNIDFDFTSPYGDPHSIYENVFFPLILLMCMALPKRGGVFNTYKEPFIVRAEIPGNFSCDMGFISQISWNKGSKSTWSVDGLPLSIHVSLTINDVFPTISMSDDISEISENGSLALYLVNMVGLVSHDTVDNFSWRSSQNLKKWDDYVNKSNIGAMVKNAVFGLGEYVGGSAFTTGASK